MKGFIDRLKKMVTMREKGEWEEEKKRRDEVKQKVEIDR